MKNIEVAHSFIISKGYEDARFLKGDDRAMYFIGRQNGNAFDIEVIHETGQVRYKNFSEESDMWITEGKIKQCESSVCNNFTNGNALCDQCDEIDDFMEEWGNGY